MKRIILATAVCAVAATSVAYAAYTLPRAAMPVERLRTTPAPETDKRTDGQSRDGAIRTLHLPGRATVVPVAAVRPDRAARGKRPAVPYERLVERYARKHGVPVALAKAVIRVESNYRAGARGRAGEVGLMQIKPSTARLMGYRGSLRGLYDPETNIRYGMKYLGQAHRLGGGTTCGTILKYNAGHGARRMNRISAAYCAKVKRILGNRRGRP